MLAEVASVKAEEKLMGDGGRRSAARVPAGVRARDSAPLGSKERATLSALTHFGGELGWPELTGC